MQLILSIRYHVLNEFRVLKTTNVSQENTTETATSPTGPTTGTITGKV